MDSATRERLASVGLWGIPDLASFGPLSPKQRALLLRGVHGGAGIANPFFIEVNSAGLTTSITTYTSGDQMGTEITCATGGGNASYGVVTSITMVDYAKVLGAVDFRFFYDTTTPAADNAAYAWSDADSNKLIAGCPVTMPSPVTDANNGVASLPNLWLQYKTGAGHANLYLDLITRSNNAVFGAVGDIHVKIGGFYFS